jgi:hypothetical protein
MAVTDGMRATWSEIEASVAVVIPTGDRLDGLKRERSPQEDLSAREQMRD